MPCQIRRRTGIKEGDRLILEVLGQQIIMQPIARTLLDLRGIIKTTEPQDFAAIRRRVIASRAD